MRKKLIGAIAVTGGLLGLGGTAVAVGGANEPDPQDQVQPAAAQADHRVDRDDDRDDWDDAEEGRPHRGNPWPEHCSTGEPTISGKNAEQLAKTRASGAEVTEIKLDRCYGPEWELELREGNLEYDVDVDANSGKIVEFETEREDD
ncbi:PepSY domain-containing protein [Salinifilum ghardaiensis]